METDIYILILSIVALILGPIVCQFARITDSMFSALDGFVFVTIGGMVLLHVVPETYTMAGWSALAALLLGAIGPGFVENRIKNLAAKAHAIALLFALLGIVFHAFADGLALVHGSGTSGATDHNMLPLAVVLHRVPVGIIVWFLLRPVYGSRIAWFTLVLLGIATVIGFVLGEESIGKLAEHGRGIFQAFVAGMLLHVVFHRSHPVNEDNRALKGHRKYDGVGAVIGFIFLWGITLDYLHPTIEKAFMVFLRLAWESAPALLLAYFGAGFVYTFMPKASIEWLRRGSAASQSVRGMAFGLPLPICSCGVVPVYRSLIAKGVPISASLSFLIATPELSIDAILITLPLLGESFTLVRVFSATVIALLIGWGIGRFTSLTSGAKTADEDNDEKLSKTHRLRNSLRMGLSDVVDDTAPWIILGLSIAALIEPLFSMEQIDYIPEYIEIAIFAILGIPMYVCASGATPLAAVLVYNGVSPGAALAFLLTGPATNITTFLMLSRLHGRHMAFTVAAGIMICAISLGFLVNVLFPGMNVPSLVWEEKVHLLGINGGCLLILVALFLASLMRIGPRGFFIEMTFGNQDDWDESKQHCHDSSQDCDGCS